MALSDAVNLEMEVRRLQAEIVRLRADLEEIAYHYIDSELASREKRGMALAALASQ
jgi:hypothetical protein